MNLTPLLPDLHHHPVLSIALILTVGLLAGRIAMKIGLPEVLGYIMVGVAISPHATGFLTTDSLHALTVISDAAIGLIVFTIGAQLNFKNLKGIGRPALQITVVQAGTVFLLVFLGTLLLGVALIPAMLLGSLAVAAAAPTTFVVVQEYNADGPFTRLLLVVVALNDILTLILFRIVVALGLSFTGGDTSVLAAAGTLTYQIAGSLIAGALLGLILGYLTQHEDNPSELFAMTLTAILLVVGGARLLGLSPLLCNLALGTAVANVSPRSLGLINAIKHTDPPVYIAFFVLAGAELELMTLWTAGIVGVGYISLRAVGKYVGSVLGSRWSKSPAEVRNYMGLALLPQAGVAIGLASGVHRYFPQYSDMINALVLAGVVVYEVLGILTLRFALGRVGEIGKMKSAELTEEGITLE
ncbi:MAG: cation:proton antiporter [Armatimonadetes bacterium]|nr:cation:proton antiporter [Armatimonadota bacterium]